MIWRPSLRNGHCAARINHFVVVDQEAFYKSVTPWRAVIAAAIDRFYVLIALRLLA